MNKEKKEKQEQKIDETDITKIPTINVGIVGHIDHGKTTLLYKISGKWAREPTAHLLLKGKRLNLVMDLLIFIPNLIRISFPVMVSDYWMQNPVSKLFMTSGSALPSG